MIDRNLFYTGITRSKNLSIVVSDSDTIRYAVGNTRSTDRSTGLIKRLHEMNDEPREIEEMADLVDYV